MKQSAISLAVVTALVWGAPRAQAQNQVSGTFTVQGATTKFAYAYVYWKDSPFRNRPKELFVLLSDIVIAPNLMPSNDEGVGKMAGMVREGKVHALELHLNPANKGLNSGENVAVFHGGLSPARFGFTGMHVFTPKTFTDTRLEGTARTEKPYTSDGVTWQYEVTFNVALPPRPQ